VAPFDWWPEAPTGGQGEIGHEDSYDAILKALSRISRLYFKTFIEEQPQQIHVSDRVLRTLMVDTILENKERSFYCSAK
jgi:hypothetical protein